MWHGQEGQQVKILMQGWFTLSGIYLQYVCSYSTRLQKICIENCGRKWLYKIGIVYCKWFCPKFPTQYNSLSVYCCFLRDEGDLIKFFTFIYITDHHQFFKKNSGNVNAVKPTLKGTYTYNFNLYIKGTYTYNFNLYIKGTYTNNFNLYIKDNCS